jgi:hypothetical protein
MQGGLNHNILWEVSMYLRSLRKYDEREMVPREEIIEKLQDLLSEFEE